MKQRGHTKLPFVRQLVKENTPLCRWRTAQFHVAGSRRMTRRWLCAMEAHGAVKYCAWENTRASGANSIFTGCRYTSVSHGMSWDQEETVMRTIIRVGWRSKYFNNIGAFVDLHVQCHQCVALAAEPVGCVGKQLADRAETLRERR